MRCSRNNINNLHLNMYAKVETPERKLTQENIIQYDKKQHQVKMTIESCTYVQLKGLKILTSHRIYVWYIQQFCDANKKIINET